MPPEWMYLPHLGIGGGWTPIPAEGNSAVGCPREVEHDTGSDRPLDAAAVGIRGRVDLPLQPPGAARAVPANVSPDNDSLAGGQRDGQRGHALAGDAAPGGEIRGRAHTPGPRSEASAALDVANSRIARSLADHAERVAKRLRCHGPQVGPTAAERLQALRRRVAARVSAAADAPVATAADASRTVAARRGREDDASLNQV
jgi:hypothetical protein